MKFFIIIWFLSLNLVTPDSYLGKWKLVGGSVIEIYREGVTFEGRIVKRSNFPIYNRNGLDNKNPDAKLRKRTIVGMVILKNLCYASGELSGGSIYNSDSGKTYEVRLLLDRNNPNVCHVEIFKENQKRSFKIKRVLD